MLAGHRPRRLRLAHLRHRGRQAAVSCAAAGRPTATRSASGALVRERAPSLRHSARTALRPDWAAVVMPPPLSTPGRRYRYPLRCQDVQRPPGRSCISRTVTRYHSSRRSSRRGGRRRWRWGGGGALPWAWCMRFGGQ